LADEPVASLDPKTSRSVLGCLREASRESGITVICNLHQVDYAMEFGERIVGIAGGRIVFDGLPSELDQEALQRIYPEGAEMTESASTSVSMTTMPPADKHSTQDPTKTGKS
jgi:phosphonate transport system ATP-binding protein